MRYMRYSLHALKKQCLILGYIEKVCNNTKRYGLFIIKYKRALFCASLFKLPSTQNTQREREDNARISSSSSKHCLCQYCYSLHLSNSASTAAHIDYSDTLCSFLLTLFHIRTTTTQPSSLYTALYVCILMCTLHNNT